MTSRTKSISKCLKKNIISCFYVNYYPKNFYRYLKLAVICILLRSQLYGHFNRNWRCQPVAIASHIYIPMYVKAKLPREKNLKTISCWVHRLGPRLAKSPNVFLRQLGQRHESCYNASREVLICIA